MQAPVILLGAPPSSSILVKGALSRSPSRLSLHEAARRGSGDRVLAALGEGMGIDDRDMVCIICIYIYTSTAVHAVQCSTSIALQCIIHQYFAEQVHTIHRPIHMCIHIHIYTCML
jgi:hypothetical protein